ncbi:MAG: glycine betaine ABC transporter substrate-binding protein [Nitriliruptoraceae bacterium]
MSRLYPSRLLAPIAVLALILAACGGDDAADDAADDTPDVDVETDAIDVPDGPTITVASFNFPESEILGEVYATALEATGYPVERELNVGARELLFPELEEGGVDLLPEYVGSAIVVGFGEDAPSDLDEGVTTLTELFADLDVTVLEPTPAANSNVFVVSAPFAEENDLSSVADLEGLDATLAGPPECEDRDTCYAGLQSIYGLDSLAFEAIGEPSARLVALNEDDAQVILLFSTDAVLADESLVALEEPEGMIPPENITPVLRTEIVDAYGDDLVDLLESVGSALTTEVLIGFNDEAGQGVAPATIAEDFLTELGVL